jgi:hypothetical protein
MAFSKRETDGYLMIDHRLSPGLKCEEVGTDKLGAGKLFEAATDTCHRCQKIQVINPKRLRERPYCRRHDRNLCDDCAAELKVSGRECESFMERVEKLHEAQQTGKVLVPWHAG